MISKIASLMLLCLQALPVWVALRGLWLIVMRPPLRFAREAVLGIFVIFMTAVLCMALDGHWQSPGAMLDAALTRLRTMEKINLVPLRTAGPQLLTFTSANSLTQLLGNTLLFVPWGFFLPLLWRSFRRIGRMALMALGLTLFIECTQLFIDRYVEIDDVLLNFPGSMAGTGLWWCVHRCFPRLDEHLLIAP